MPRRIIAFEVDPWQQHGVAVSQRLARGANQHLFCASIYISLRTRARGCASGTIDDEIDAQASPIRQRLRDIVIWNLTSADDEAVLCCFDLLMPTSVVSIR